MRERNWKEGRTLVSDEALSIHQEFIAFGLTSKNRVIIENQTLLASSRKLLE